MSTSRRWFDRTFDLGLPVDRLPELVDRLRATPDRIQEMIEGLADEMVSRRDGRRWSIVENIGHLCDLEALSERRLDDFDHGAEALYPADLENRATWDANYNARPCGEVMRAFREARVRFVARLEALPIEARRRTALHPRLQQPMGVVDLAFFMAEHDDHHVARIRELVQLVGTLRP
jgi:DinB superfamily